jgi:hypothetical protein
MYSKFKIGFLRFFGLNYKRLYRGLLRHAFGMGDPLRDSREAKIFIFFDFKN